jgi:hypothetical protein
MTPKPLIRLKAACFPPKPAATFHAAGSCRDGFQTRPYKLHDRDSMRCVCLLLAQTLIRAA